MSNVTEKQDEACQFCRANKHMAEQAMQILKEPMSANDPAPIEEIKELRNKIRAAIVALENIK